MSDITKPVVRRATWADGPAFITLVNELAEYEKLDPPDAAACERLQQDAFGDAPRIRVYLAERDGEALAYAITVFSYSSFLARPTLYIEDLYVTPRARKSGAGAAMFRHLASEAVAADCGRMEWMTLDWNRLAQEVWEHYGAQHMKEWYVYRMTRDQLETLTTR